MKATRSRKIAWLLRNPSVWEGFPKGESVGDGIGHEHRIFIRMQHAKLYSTATDWIDADICGLISDARQKRRIRWAKRNGWKPAAV